MGEILSSIGAIILVFGLFVVPGLIAGVREYKKELAETEKRKQDEEYEREIARKRDIERQERELAALLTSTTNKYLNAPRILSSVDEQLDYAETAFKDRAFAPFWDQIESVAIKLAEYRKEIDSLNSAIHDCTYRASLLPSLPPGFAPPSIPLPDAEAIAQRFQSIVRRAQTDFQFASIFEQRRTNKLLAHGFGTLAEAISNMGSMMKSSLSALSSTIQASLDQQSRVLTEIRNSTRSHPDLE